jgi:hypothetical protein
MEGLTPGRVVHFVLGPKDEESGKRHRAAIITNVKDADAGVLDMNVQLSKSDIEAVVGANTVLAVEDIKHSADPQEGTWHWVEKA